MAIAFFRIKFSSSNLLIICLVCNISLSAFANNDITEAYKDAFTHLNGRRLSQDMMRQIIFMISLIKAVQPERKWQ